MSRSGDQNSHEQDRRPTRWPWRAPLAIVLGLLTWWGIAYWLEPRPLWTKSFLNGMPTLEPLLEDATGRWLLTTDLRKEELFKIVSEHQDFAALTEGTRPNQLHLLILDTHTGQKQSQLTIKELSPEPFPGQRAKLLGDSLWWFNTCQLENEQHLELHRWQFTKNTEDQLVKSWPIQKYTPIHVAFAEGDGPCFVIQSTVPWELGLVSKAISPWSSLTSMLAQVQEIHSYARISRFGNSVKENELLPRTRLIPLVSTYALPLNANEVTPRCLATWTLPAYRWNIPVFGKDMRWLAWSDCQRSESGTGHELKSYAHPTGVLLYHGHTGQPCTLQADKGFRDYPQNCYSLGDYLATESVDYGDNQDSRLQCRLFDPVKGEVLAWPEGMKNRLLEFKRVRESSDGRHDLMVLDHFPGCLRSPLSSFQVFRAEQQSLTLSAEPEVPYEFDLSDWLLPSVYRSNQFAMESSGDFRPNWVKTLEKVWPQTISWLNRLFPPARSHVIILQADTGKLLKVIPGCQQPQWLSSASKLYLKKTKLNLTDFSEEQVGLEAWSIPLSLWSPWWGRGTGLIVTCSLLILLRRKPHPVQ